MVPLLAWGFPYLLPVLRMAFLWLLQLPRAQALSLSLSLYVFLTFLFLQVSHRSFLEMGPPSLWPIVRIKPRGQAPTASAETGRVLGLIS